MNVDTFLKYWGLRENPFKAEEARDDQVYLRIMAGDMTHPDFEKIFGSPGKPSTSVVFGEKGSGKTAIRLLMEHLLAEHNQAHPDQKTWVLKYDEFNPILDRLERHPESKNFNIRLVDHQDALLSLAVTRLVDQVVGDEGQDESPRKLRRTLRKMARQKRIDLAELVMLYDQPTKSSLLDRWSTLKQAVGVGTLMNLSVSFWLTVILLACSVGGAAMFKSGAADVGTIAFTILAILGMAFAGYHWLSTSWRCGRLARRIAREVRAVERLPGTTKKQLGDFARGDFTTMPLPVPGDQDSRYELTSRFLRILEALGYNGVLVLMDRVDEPVLVNGDAQKMKAIIWPLMNNKLLQQNGVGFKMLLPMELGHLIKKEDADFYQQARLDKQNLIEKLEWTGATLYDICSRRLQGCRDTDARIERLVDLFAEDVRSEDVIDALDQMSQPRDAFKFLYQVIQEHCQNTSDDAPNYKIPKLVLDQIRKRQSQRVRDLQRGLAPA